MLKKLILMLALTVTTFAGSHFGRGVDGEPVGLDPDSPIQYHLETGDLNAAFDHNLMRTLIAQAFARWGGIPGSRLRVEGDVLIDRDVNDIGDAAGLIAAGHHLVILDEDGSMLHFFGLDPQAPGVVLFPAYDQVYYQQFLVILNGPALLNHDQSQLEAVLLHMTGRALGLGQSNVNGDDYSLQRANGAHGVPPLASVEVMYPGFFGSELTRDDISGFLALYGESDQGAPGLGAISGRVLMSDGVTPAGGVNVIVRSTAGGGAYFNQAAATITAPSSGGFTIVGLPPGGYSLEIADIAVDNGAVFSDAIRTDSPELAWQRTPWDELHPKVLGAFPGLPEFYNGGDESADPSQDDPALITPIQVTADQTVSGVEVVFNRDAQKPFTRLLYAWLSNNVGNFESVLIANNYGDENLAVTLTARRASGQQETVTRMIPAGGFLREEASCLFPELGSGPGYSVELQSSSDKIRGRWVTRALQAESGASPSQGVAVRVPAVGEEPSERVGNRLIFGYLAHGENLVSVPVLVNSGDQVAQVSLRFFNQQGREVGNHMLEDLAPYLPHPLAISSIIPDNREDLVMIAESDQQLSGVAFVFDSHFNETAIGNASAVSDEEPGGKRLLYPWISNRDGEFESILVVNNYADEAQTIGMTARRANGDAQTIEATIEAHGFLAARASALFPLLGSGAGYAVELFSPSDQVAGQWVTHNLAGASGQSPSQGVAVAIPPLLSRNERAGGDILLGYLPLAGDLTSAPVVVNLGTEATDVSLRFYDRDGNLLLEDADAMAQLAPMLPRAVPANSLLTTSRDDVSLIASSPDQIITGVAFVFNSRYSEPAIGNGSSVVPQLPTPTTYAITNVAVIPMDSERILTNQTVVIRDQLIHALGPSEAVTLPDDSVIIDGSGKYLMPGMTDAHTHIKDEGDLIMNIANGVTTVLNMGDTAYESPRMKARLADGLIDGPTMYSAMFIRGVGEVHLTPTNEQETRTMVTQARQAGYDFLKPYNLDQVRFDVLMDEAARQGMPAVGHMHPGIDLDHILSGGQSMIAHVEEYKNGFFNNQIDYNRIDEARKITLQHGATVTACLSTLEATRISGGHNQAGYQQLLQRPGVGYMNPSMLAAWNSRFLLSEGGFSEQQYAFMEAILEDFRDNGVSIILGTDAPGVPGMVSGFAMHEELRVLAQAGWRPYDCLRAATAAAGAFINAQLPQSGAFGTVTPGSRADLILLNANPLEDVALVRERVGVMVRGQWFSEAVLQQMLDDVAAGYQQ